VSSRLTTSLAPSRAVTQLAGPTLLIDVSAVAREAGLRYPVALTSAAWGRCVTVPPGVECQDEAGRLWDVLWRAIRWPKTRPPPAGGMGRRE
jgi:hypothetical protein